LRDAGIIEYYDDQGKRYPQSVIHFSNGNRRSSYHPTQKPLDLLRYLVTTYSNKDDLVFDGYSGSGTTAAACLLEQRKFIGSEINQNYFNYSVKRIEELMQHG
jgi:site-specific DNA-methyltransferase (adenine-specific)